MKKKRRSKYKLCEAVVFDPDWGPVDPRHPLKKDEVVYFLGEIPNAPGHCLVVKHESQVVPMIHTADLREATDDEV